MNHSKTVTTLKIYRASWSTASVELCMDDITSGVLTIKDGKQMIHARLNMTSLDCLARVMEYYNASPESKEE